jgi:hypothetical protein
VVQPKTDNGDPISKIAVRQQALEWAPKSPSILECYAGEGHMYRAAWKETASRHLGMDKRLQANTEITHAPPNTYYYALRFTVVKG